jgi:peroxiredoxin (alkyl hydroperoxide reductase subunit C)
VQAIQETDLRPVSTPEGWRPGGEVLMPTPVTVAEADARAAQPNARDWYFSVDSGGIKVS